MAPGRRFLAGLIALAALPAGATESAAVGLGGPVAANSPPVSSGAAGGSAPYVPDPKRRQELRTMLIQDCGSCHGGTLKGGLGPPLTAEALAGRDPYRLARVILDGRHGTPMAPWKLFLNELEAEWLARQLLSGAIDDR